MTNNIERKAARDARTTRLVWHKARLAGLLGFALGLLVAVLIVLAVDAIPDDEPACTYHTPLRPVPGCTFIMNGNG